MTDIKNIDNLNGLYTELEKSLYFEDKKFKAPMMAGDIVFHGFNITEKQQVHRGFLVTNDNKEIFRYNGGYYTNDGEDFIKDVIQYVLGKKSNTHYKNEVIEWIKDNKELRIDRDIFNYGIDNINLENGYFDLKTNEFREHTSAVFFNYQIPIRYNPDSEINQIDQFLKDVLYQDDIPVFQELVGYCLYRNYNIQKAFMFDGDGCNGKSTLINLLIKFLGENNISNVSLQDLIYKRFTRGQLYGKLLNVYSDLSDQAVKETGVFKMLSGGDVIFADRKFKEPFYFRNYAKLIFSCNKLPISNDDTDAYFRRWILLSFPNKFEGKDCNPNILEEITTEEELSGLFNWGIKGLKRLLKKKEFSYNKSTEIIRDEYERKSSPILAFVKDCLEIDPQSTELKEDVYKAYKEYCKKERLPIKANNSFSRELKQHIVSIDDEQLGTGKRAWIGVKICD